METVIKSNISQPLTTAKPNKLKKKKNHKKHNHIHSISKINGALYFFYVLYYKSQTKVSVIKAT